MLRAMYVFRSMDDYHTSRRGRGVSYPLPRFLRVGVRRRKQITSTYSVDSQSINDVSFF